MEKGKHTWLTIGISMLLVGCSTTEMIKQNMDSRNYSLVYKMNSKTVDVKQHPPVRIDSVRFDPADMGDKTMLYKEKRFLIPLGFVNVWDYSTKCIQGKDMFRESVPVFWKSSLTNEINRSGSFRVDTAHQSEYSIDLAIDKLRTEGPYLSSGITVLVFFSHSETAGPAVSALQVSYTLKKGGQPIYTHSFSSKDTTRWDRRSYLHYNVMQEDFAAKMVKATSNNFKKANEWIVADLNDFFSKSVR